MRASSWQFEVEDAFAVAGRGTAVLGRLTGTIPSSPLAALMQVGDEIRRVPEVWVEFARVRGDDRIALLLRGVDTAAVPVGSTITADDTADDTAGA